MNQSIYTEYKDLLAEELTSEEVFDLLERLSARDLGGSEYPTLGAVVEATNVHPVEAGRLLAEIRKEDFEERFGLQLQYYGKRIDSLEERTHKLENERSSSPNDAKPTAPSIGYWQTPLQSKSQISETQSTYSPKIAAAPPPKEEFGVQTLLILIMILVGLIWAVAYFNL